MVGPLDNSYLAVCAPAEGALCAISLESGFPGGSPAKVGLEASSLHQVTAFTVRQQGALEREPLTNSQALSWALTT